MITDNDAKKHSHLTLILMYLYITCTSKVKWEFSWDSITRIWDYYIVKIDLFAFSFIQKRRFVFFILLILVNKYFLKINNRCWKSKIGISYFDFHGISSKVAKRENTRKQGLVFGLLGFNRFCKSMKCIASNKSM